MKIFVGISGASGSIYGGRLIKVLSRLDHEVTVCVSDGALAVMLIEESLGVGSHPGRDETVAAFLDLHGVGGGEVAIAEPGDMASAFASGSSLAAAAVVCPCSMSTLGSIASGVTRNLIHRVADVMLKESRPLALVPRETPLSEIHLRNMLRVRQAGALLVPAMPAFYHHPETIEDLVDFVAGKVLDSMKIDNDLYRRWKG